MPFFKARVVDPIVSLLRMGLTPKKVAWSVALGVVVGVFPALGWTSMVGLLLGLLFRLNQPALQAANYAVYPLQFLLLIPFYQLGAGLFSAPLPAQDARDVVAIIDRGLPFAIQVLWTTTWHAIVVWCALAPLATLTIYVVLVPMFSRIAGKIRASNNPPHKTPGPELHMTSA